MENKMQKKWIIPLTLFLSFSTIADDYGKPKITNINCDSSVFSSVDTICTALESGNPLIHCQPTAQKCVKGEQQIFVGNQIEIPSVGSNQQWSGFGGLGLTYAGANVCMLRDIKDGAITSQSKAPTPIGNVSINQNISYYSFNKNTYEWVGYHNAKTCVPAFGCLDLFSQKISVRAVSKDLKNATYTAGNLKVLSAHGLEVQAEGLAQGYKVSTEALKVPTPYGVVSVYPEFEFGRAYGYILSPYNSNNTKSLYSGAWGEAKMTDIYGMITGAEMKGIFPSYGSYGDRTIDNRKVGYISQVAFGSRDANTKSSAWAPTPNVEFPFRPDFKISQARSNVEKIPNAYVKAELAVEYSPVDLIPAKIRNNHFITVNFSVFAKPTIGGVFTSQFNIFNSELVHAKKLAAVNGPIDYTPINMEQYKNLHIQSSTSASSRYALEAGIDLTLHLHVPLPWPLDDIDLNLINVHPRTTVLEVNNVDYDESSKLAQAHSSSSKILATKNLFYNYKTFNNYSGAPINHLKECIAKPTADGSLPPTPEYKPGNEVDLLKGIEYPCNICVMMDTYTYKDENKKTQTIEGFLEVLFPASQDHIPSNLRWKCDKVYESGCHDVCIYNPETDELKVVKTAKQLKIVNSGTPLRCN